MLNIRKIRDDVVSRLKTFRNVDEEKIHAAYSGVLQEHSTKAVAQIRDLAARIGVVRATTRDGRWTMIERAQLDDCITRLESLARDCAMDGILVQFPRSR